MTGTALIENAKAPREVTLAGIRIVEMLVVLNAEEPIVNKVLGRLTDVTPET